MLGRSGKPAEASFRELWHLLSPESGGSHACSVWPFDEDASLHARSDSEPAHGAAARGGARGRAEPGPCLAAPLELLHRKGEFVRAVCVNALNPSQLAASLSQGAVK